MRQDLLGLLDRHYPRVARDLLGPLIGLLSAARVACSDDLDKLLILLVVVVRTAEHPSFEHLTTEQLTSGEFRVFPSLGTNMRSIAESTGMPRESVRRKVADLIAKGWIARDGNDLQLTVQAFRELAPLREGLKIVAARHAEAVLALLGAREDTPQPGPSANNRLPEQSAPPSTEEAK
jgi:DNA-binding MarR family transcriptional regulator